MKEIICILCKKLGTLAARGLCSRCYPKERVKGTLYQFDKVSAAWKTIANDVATSYDNGKTCLEIATTLGISDTKVRNILKKQGIKRRRTGYDRIYTLNEGVFDTLDNEGSVYWLGFIYADGHVRKGSLILHLGEIDEEHLRHLNQFMDSNAAITRRTRNRITPSVYIQINSSLLSRRLHSLGIVTGRNNFDLLQRELPSNLYRHFIRGYIDGDGYINRPPAKPKIKIVGQRDILIWISRVVSETLGVAERNLSFSRNIYTITFSGIYIAQSVAEWLYQDATIFLGRKYENFRQW